MKAPGTSATIVLGVTGSISAYRACDLVLEMRERGWDVIPVLSKDAHHFVTPLTLESLAGREIYQDFFAVPGRPKPIHIELAKAADAIVIAPASADIIARMSLGLADDILSCTVLAAMSPVVVVPAMNDKMYANSVTQEHVERLKKRGFRFVDPVVGKLVCSDRAMGHIAGNAAILNAVGAVLEGGRSANGKKQNAKKA